MDEPTLGLDPQTTFSIRDITRDINKSGVTVILTTHAMTEAEALSDRVAIIDHGQIAALDTPHNLKKMISTSDTTIFSTRITNLTSQLIEKIKSLEVVTAVAHDNYDLKISASGSDSLNQIIDTIRREGGNISSIVNTAESTLEDVFLTVTGKDMRDHANEKSTTYNSHGQTPKSRVR
jgi:ABC-2 type transport system ATP-binding protein